MNVRTLILCLMTCCIAHPAGAVGMRLERERLVTMEGPETAGFNRVRFDFQHNFKDYTLNPAVDLTLAYGVWDNVQVEAEALVHNLETTTFNKTNTFQYNVVNWTLKWAILDQTQDDWFSLAAGATVGRTDNKSEFRDLGTGAHNLQRDHAFDDGGYVVATYDTPWVTPYLSVQYARFASKGLEDYYTLHPALTKPKPFDNVSPGFGGRFKLWESRTLKIHAIGDWQGGVFKTYNEFLKRRYALHAWGAGLQFMTSSPHIFTFFVSNTFGDTIPDGLFGGVDTFYNFRWSYRF